VTRIHGKIVGFPQTVRSLRELEEELGAEKLLREGLRQAAAEPLIARMRETISRDTGLTAADIGAVDAPPTPGMVKIVVGAKGGKGGRGFIAAFLEWGTSRMPARPWARPSYEAEKAHFAPRLTAFLRERMAAVVRSLPRKAA
jgi:HK97 gp10 family phage protein